MILRPLGNVISVLGNVKIFKGKAGCNDTLALGDWVLVGKPVYFQNKPDILKSPNVDL